MAMTPVYCLTVPGTPSIEISQDELRSILGQIEADLHRSKAYRRALAQLQKVLGESAEQAKLLVKAVGREAIGLAFQKFAKQHQEVLSSEDRLALKEPLAGNGNKAELEGEEENQGEDSERGYLDQEFPSGSLVIEFTANNSHQYAAGQVDEQENLASEPHVVRTTGSTSVKSPDNSGTEGIFQRLTKPTKKHTKAELAEQMAAEQRLERLRQIGEELKQVRNSQCLTVQQVYQQTRVPIHLIEALENGRLELLPEDVYVRGFIRRIGDALRLNGAALAASLPSPDPTKTVLPSWYRSQVVSSASKGFELQAMHLYVGYTALVAGAVGGLALLSQQAPPNRAVNPDVVTPPQKSVSQQQAEPSATPGLKSSKAGVTVGADIAPPEAL